MFTLKLLEHMVSKKEIASDPDKLLAVVNFLSCNLKKKRRRIKENGIKDSWVFVHITADIHPIFSYSLAVNNAYETRSTIYILKGTTRSRYID